VLDICMVTYQSKAYEGAALRSLRRTTDVPHRLTVIDNEPENRPLSRVWNEFAKASTAEHVCFANPDVVFARWWANRLLRAFGLERVAVACPSTPGIAGVCNASPLQRLPSWPPEQVDALADRVPFGIVDDVFVTGYCYCVSRRWLLASGGFDEVRFPFYGQECDVNFRAEAAGRRVVCVRNAVVYHYGGRSTQDKDRERLSLLRQEAARNMGKRWPRWRDLGA
jgi:GT2 family glycosyltransferase